MNPAAAGAPPPPSASAPPPGAGLLQGEVDAMDLGHPDAAVRLADLFFTRAVALRASDIHIHPRAGDLSVRFRVDGRLSPAATLPPSLAPLLITRLKVMAKLAVFQRALPQDGRIDWVQPSSPSDARLAPGGAPGAAGALPIRVSFLPTLHGESVVARLPETQASLLSLESLGMARETLCAVRQQLSLEQGAILLTGPSSSGKTTTIYAMLSEIHQTRGHAAHILTLEDPVERELPFAGQTPIRAELGLGWAEGLRAIVRQDPNVIMIGEIRDPETARIAIQAGLTGHLVISTVHSGRAVGVLVRLIHMQIEPFLVASSVTAALAQRLARRLCPACRRPASPDPGPQWRRHMGLPLDFPLWTAPGCPECGGMGARGRIGIFELARMTPALGELVLARSSQEQLQRAAFPGGGALLACALARAREGAIGYEELPRFLLPGTEVDSNPNADAENGENS